jgi:DNA-binding protein Fis
MRLNFRIKLSNWTLFFMIAKTQTLEGVTSKCLDEPIERHLHHIFWDLEGCTLPQAEEKLSEIQFDYALGDIIIFSDREGLYRA